MTRDQTERLVVVAEKLTVSFAAMVALMKKRLEKEFPSPGEPQDAIFVRVGENEKQEPQSRKEYEEFPVDQPGHFQKILTKIKSDSKT